MRILFAGTPEPALPSLRALLESPRHEVIAVLTRADAPAGRGRRLESSPIAKLAEEAGVEVLKPNRPRDPEFLARLGELAPDCCPIVAYGGLVPRAALDIPRHGWINLHFSLLPAWRGAAPVQRALLAGDDMTGASTFLLEEGLDTGPVLGTLTEEIRRSDTSGDLLGRLAKSGAHLLSATLDAIEDGTARPVTQEEEHVSLAAKILAADARIDWKAPALRIDRLVRACTPAPGAWTVLHGGGGGESAELRVKIFPVSPLPGAIELAPGHIVLDKRGLLVGTGSGHSVRLGDVQPQGKRRMPAADWARGLRFTGDETFS